MSKELAAFKIMVKDNDLELPYHNTIQAIETALKKLEQYEEYENMEKKLMSKELRAFRKICKNLNSYEFTDEYKKNKKLIEIALKEKANIEKTINELFSKNGKVITTIEIKNKLKAFEIIKETQVNIFTVMHSKNYEDFRKKCFDVNCLYLRFPTQEEYDLLKEELL